MSKAVSLEYLLRDTPQEKLDWQVSSSDLSEVAKRLSVWRLLAPHLHITQEQEEEIVGDYPSDLQLQSLKCLQKWSHDQDSGATYGALVTAIDKIENADLIDEICKLLSTQSSPSPPHDRTLHNYTDVLRLSYSRLRLPDIFGTGDDEDVPSPSECYINLVMTSRERIQRGGVDKERMALAQQGNTSGMADHCAKEGQRVPIDVKDIFTIDNIDNKVILIEGAPGSGKTTLFQYITQKWAARELFQQFSLVLLVKLRDREVQEAQGLIDLLPFEYNSAKREAITKKVAQTNGKGILLLFDGWDELPNDKQKESMFLEVLKLPGKHYLSNAAVLVSARPVKSASIQKFATTRIEILGFTPKQIEMYVTESLPEKEAGKLISSIREDPVLQGNCYLPLSIAIITHTYITLGHELPATFCRIIMELALSCLYRHIKKHTPYGYLYVTLNSFDDLQISEKEQFNRLCERAYASFLRQEYSFHDPNMPTLGLMQSVQSFAVRGTKNTQHYFLHMSLHELCAARHLATLQPSEQLAVLSDYLEDKAVGIENVLGFFSALGGWNSKVVKDFFVSHAVELFGKGYREQFRHMQKFAGRKCPTSQIQLLQYFHEAQSAELCKSLPSALRIMYPPGSFPSTRDIVALRYILSKKRVKELYVEALSANQLKVLEPALRMNIPEELKLGDRAGRGVNFGDEGVKIIADIIKGRAVKIFYCVNAGMTEVGVGYLVKALRNQYCQLTYLSVAGNKIGNTALVHLTNNLGNIKHLCLNHCGIGDEGLILFSAILPKTNLIDILIGDNNISSKGLMALANAIMNTRNFVMVDLYSITASYIIPETDVKKFIQRLLRHPHISSIMMNVHTVDKEFNELFNLRRFSLGLNYVNIHQIPWRVKQDNCENCQWPDLECMK